MNKLTVLALIIAILLMACNGNNQDANTQIEHPKALVSENVEPIVTNELRDVSDTLTQEYADSRKKRLSNIDYTLSIDLISVTDAYNGTVNLTFDLKSNEQNLTVDFTGGTVAKVEVNGAQVAVDYSGYFITLPSESLLVGSNLVDISYQHPYDQDGTGLHRFVDPEDGKTYLYTYLWPYYANRLFPHFDQPNLKASYEMTVRAKGDWQVVSSTMQDSIVEDGPDKIWHFPRTKKFSSYIFSLHAGPYKIWQDMAGDVPIRLMARQTLAQYVDVKEWFDYTKMGLIHYKNYFDIAYPFEKYDQVIVPDFNIGAMENVAAVTFTEYVVQRGPSSRFQRQNRANIILHEMAHMWFGNLVTKDWWNGLWLNESFATLMASIAVSNIDEFSDLWHDFYLNTNLTAISADKMVSTHPIEVPVPSTNDFFSVFDSITYQKGASVLKQLSHYTGQENFRLGVSNYLKKHAWSNTELKDFIEAQSQQSGLELTEWSNDWLYKAGVNSIKVEYTCEAGVISQFKVIQTAAKDYSTLRSQRLQLALFEDKEDDVVPYSVTSITVTGSLTKIPEVDGLKCPDLIYPNFQGWGYTEVELDDKSMKNALQSIGKSQDPLLRSMLWTSLLDNPKTNIEKVINALEAEDNDRIINQILNALISKFDKYERQGNKSVKVLGVQLEALLWRQLTEEKGSDNIRIIRLEWYIDLVRSNEGRLHLVELLDSSVKIPALAMSQELRWQLIRRLAILGDDNVQQYLVNEKQADPSDAGKIAAISVESSLENVEIKKQWIAHFMDNDAPLPLSYQRAAMGSLFPANQVAIQAQFLPELIAALPMIKASKDNYYQQSFARDLFAGICTKHELSLIESALDKDKIGTTLYRFLSENVQKAQLCVDEK
jgi:aminopeptidase N